MYNLGETIGEGAQGKVFKLEEDFRLCAKVFHGGKRHGMDRNDYYRRFYGIESLPNYEYLRFLNITTKLPDDLLEYFVDIYGVDKVCDCENKEFDAVIMELVFNSRGEVAKTLKQHLLDGGDFTPEMVKIIDLVRAFHKRYKTAVLDFNINNILVVDPSTPKFIDFAIGYKMRPFQPWVRIPCVHDGRVDKTFKNSFRNLPEDVCKKWCTLQESNL